MNNIHRLQSDAARAACCAIRPRLSCLAQKPRCGAAEPHAYLPLAEINNAMTESDWKKYSARVSEWRERYLDRRNRALTECLQEHEKTPTERFWETRDRIESDARTLRDCFDRHSRSKMKLALMLMLRHGIVAMDDLSDFSDELQDDLRRGMAAFD